MISVKYYFGQISLGNFELKKSKESAYCNISQSMLCSSALSLSKSGVAIAVSKLYLNSNSWD